MCKTPVSVDILVNLIVSLFYISLLWKLTYPQMQYLADRYTFILFSDCTMIWSPQHDCYPIIPEPVVEEGSVEGDVKSDVEDALLIVMSVGFQNICNPSFITNNAFFLFRPKANNNLSLEPLLTPIFPLLLSRQHLLLIPSLNLC